MALPHLWRYAFQREIKGKGDTFLSSEKKGTKKHPANRLESMNKLASASLARVAMRVPGQPEHRKKPAKPSSLGFAGFFFCVQRCAKRTAWPASLALSGNGVRRKPCWRKIPQQERRQTQPSSVPSRAPRRNTSVKIRQPKSARSFSFSLLYMRSRNQGSLLAATASSRGNQPTARFSSGLAEGETPSSASSR